MTSAVSRHRQLGLGSGGGGGRGRGGSGCDHNQIAAAATDDDTRPRITAGEQALLDEIPTKFADWAWIVDDNGDSAAMWPLRPSSAAASLQTHPSYTTDLFDNDAAVRPVSGAGEPRRAKRPKTGGHRLRGDGRTAATSGRERERRLTVTGVESINESNLLSRRTFIQQSINADLKLKVCVRVYCRQF